MGPCLRKLLPSAENEEDKLLTSSEYEDDYRTTGAFVEPISEASRISASTSALVITHSYFKFSAISIGESKNNSTLSQYYTGDDDFSYRMKTRFQYDFKLFPWPSP